MRPFCGPGKTPLLIPLSSSIVTLSPLLIPISSSIVTLFTGNRRVTAEGSGENFAALGKTPLLQPFAYPVTLLSRGNRWDFAHRECSLLIEVGRARTSKDVKF